MNPVDEIFELFEQRGGADYGGERVSQLEHALRCAALAEEAGADAALTSAALLHDIGHLVHELGREPATRGIDDRHELRGREWLSRRFGEDVTAPVRQHVNAKRYLTATDPGYFAPLSPSSVRSLALQGGPFSAELAAGFFSLPHAPAAVRLRRWDEGAKIPGKPTPGLEHFRPISKPACSPGKDGDRSSCLWPAADHGAAQPAGNPIDHADGGQDQQDDESDLVEIVGADLL